MSKPKKAKLSEAEATPGTVMAAKIRARANKLTASEREALSTEAASIVHGGVVVAADPKSRKQRAARALANHPRAAQILGSVDFRDPTSREIQTAASLKDRALRVRSAGAPTFPAHPTRQ